MNKNENNIQSTSLDEDTLQFLALDDDFLTDFDDKKNVEKPTVKDTINEIGLGNDEDDDFSIPDIVEPKIEEEVAEDEYYEDDIDSDEYYEEDLEQYLDMARAGKKNVHKSKAKPIKKEEVASHSRRSEKDEEHRKKSSSAHNRDEDRKKDTSKSKSGKKSSGTSHKTGNAVKKNSNNNKRKYAPETSSRRPKNYSSKPVAKKADYEYEEDEELGFFSRIGEYFSETTAMDRIVAILGITILLGAILTGSLYFSAKNKQAKVEEFASIGKGIEGINIIGENGLIAVADAQSVNLADMIDLDEEDENISETNEDGTISVTLAMTSILSDLKIKFVNKNTEKLISGIPFEVEVKSGSKSYNLVDEDKDGIIYETGIDAGTYSVKLVPFSDGQFAQYILPAGEATVKVTDQIAYKKVDIKNEIKSESEVNAAKEDTAQQTQIEGALTDTVEWVESTKTEITDAQIDKGTIADPSVTGMLSSFVKLSQPADPENPGEGGETSTPSSETPDTSSTSTETSSDSSTGTDSSSGNSSGTGSTSDTSTSTATTSTTTTSSSASTTTSILSTSTTSTSTTSTQTTVTYTAVTASGSGDITVGGTGKITASTSPAGGKCEFSSSNTGVATVASDGTVTGVSAGTATITIKCGSASTTVTVTVVAKNDKRNDNKTKLKDKSGNQVYIKKSDGSFVEATYADYYTASAFYIKRYKYTGWQTIEGYTYFFDKNGNYVTGEQVINGAKYTFGGDGKLSAGSGSVGIDVSKWNGTIDWNAVRNSGVSYAIIRCGYRGSSSGGLIQDPTFKSNIAGAKAAGLKVGVYFYSQAVNEVEAVEEASTALSLVSGYGLDFPIFIDVEGSGGRGDSISASQRTAVCKAFCQTIANSGYKAGVYSNKTWLSSYMNVSALTGYKIWLAQYNTSVTYSSSRYDIWQYTSMGRVSGINGNVDMNINYNL